MPKPNTIRCGDAVEYTKRVARESVALTLFSPPYDKIRTYSGIFAYDHVALGKNVYDATQDGGVCAVVIGDGTTDGAKSLTTFRLCVDWVDKAGWRLFECCVYKRHGKPGAWWSKRFRVDHEYILLFLKGQRPAHFDKSTLAVKSKHAGRVWGGTDRTTAGGFRRVTPVAVKPTKCRGTVWRYKASNTEGNRLKLKHPATFPDKLAADVIRCFTRPGDLVMDPMCGSGTTCVMAAKEGRRFLGNDVSAEYVEIAKRRLRDEVGYDCP